MNSEECHGMTISLDHIRQAVKEYLYKFPTSKIKKGEFITHLELGALQDGDLIPVHYWTGKEEQEEREVYLEYSTKKNGKST